MGSPLSGISLPLLSDLPILSQYGACHNNVVKFLPKDAGLIPYSDSWMPLACIAGLVAFAITACSNTVAWAQPETDSQQSSSAAAKLREDALAAMEQIPDSTEVAALLDAAWVSPRAEKCHVNPLLAHRLPLNRAESAGPLLAESCHPGSILQIQGSYCD